MTMELPTDLASGFQDPKPVTPPPLTPIPAVPTPQVDRRHELGLDDVIGGILNAKSNEQSQQKNQGCQNGAKIKTHRKITRIRKKKCENYGGTGLIS